MVVVYKYTTKTDEKPVKNEFLYKRNGRLCKYYLCKNDSEKREKREKRRQNVKTDQGGKKVMGMKKKMLSATLCAVMVGSLAAPAFTVQAADDTLVYWSMWEATEPQGQVIQEAVDAYTEQTGVKVDLQFKGRTGNREALQPALDGGTQIDIFDEDIDRVNGMYGKYLLDLEDLAK